MTVSLAELVQYLDELLEISQWEKLDSSLNGLQVEGGRKVGKIAFAVDACEQTFQSSRDLGVQMLITHHGLFWGKPLPLTGTHRARLKLLLESDISLYAAHLPLDFHPLIGHNACIARGLGLENKGPLTQESGLEIGTLARPQAPLEFSEFVRRVDSLLDTSSRSLPFGPARIDKVGIISGHGSKVLDEALSARIDTFLTGESSHTFYHFAREFGLNVVFAGHYATEVPGLKELAGRLEERFGLSTVFIPAPTGF
ncbi:MAG: Nif3-like dinuclear metal center hexameric protein [Candidatus Glassbacteria bacterium GWA2_58_10]|uniref:GTP cyclohydrolase 1 type 2 homolog n=1 Tax=Candidatus Glassbacteria bacterium GWA2_58_10 TaxID=1817865 RepID=A0A1F5YHR9_9BACT|nr:MAG: Nif3-like dinuclear metal center hexameric protein [Candidatus Glassbacteria bacterium GWA2_58_10]